MKQEDETEGTHTHLHHEVHHGQEALQLGKLVQLLVCVLHAEPSLANIFERGLSGHLKQGEGTGGGK